MLDIVYNIINSVFDQFQIFHNLDYLRIYEYLIIYQFPMNLQIIVILGGFVQFIWLLFPVQISLKYSNLYILCLNFIHCEGSLHLILWETSLL